MEKGFFSVGLTEMNEMRSHKVVTIALLVIVLLITFTGMVCADQNVPAIPEIQGLATATGMNVQGTITETDAGAWRLDAAGIPLRGDDPSLQNYPDWALWGGYQGFLNDWNWWLLLEPDPGSLHLQDMLNAFIATPTGSRDHSAAAADLLAWLQKQGSPLTPPLQDQEVQYTTGYNDQVMAVSGQSTFAKTMTVSTGNKIAGQSNIRAGTSLQYIAIDTGRATRTEDLLLDGASQATTTSNAILCPFVTGVSPVIPAFCNIEQAGSSFDTTLTSVVTHADDRFVGTDSTFPVVLNYNINAGGITLSDGTSSPMIGSVSANLKVHVQEARNVSSIPDNINIQYQLSGVHYNPESIKVRRPRILRDFDCKRSSQQIQQVDELSVRVQPDLIPFKITFTSGTLNPDPF